MSLFVKTRYWTRRKHTYKLVNRFMKFVTAYNTQPLLGKIVKTYLRKKQSICSCFLNRMQVDIRKERYTIKVLLRVTSHFDLNMKSYGQHRQKKNKLRTLSSNSTRTDLGLNLGLRRDKPATKSLSHVIRSAKRHT